MSLCIKESVEIARLNCRISGPIKKRAEDAARMLGQSITTFTETALSEKAEDVFARLCTIRLSERDFELFVNTINSDTEPTPKLKQAAANYKRLRLENPESNW